MAMCVVDCVLTGSEEGNRWKMPYRGPLGRFSTSIPNVVQHPRLQAQPQRELPAPGHLGQSFAV